MIEQLPIEDLHLARDENVIHVWSDHPLAVISSAVVGAELREARHIINTHVHTNYDCNDPRGDLELCARALGIREPFVGMMTAARLDRVQVIMEKNSDAMVIAIVTVGLSHPTAAGITPVASRQVGTINSILIADARLSDAARVNAVITATEAKTLALVEANIRAPHGGLASGTGTDSIVLATTERGARFEYAGPISPIGVLIARAVRRAMQDGMRTRINADQRG